jgi:hypothetical protein
MMTAFLSFRWCFYVALCGSVLMGGGRGWAAESPGPEALRERAQDLQREIIELREQGRNEQASRLESEVRRLREQAEGFERERRGFDPDRPLPLEPGPERQELIRKIRELRLAGRHEEAAELRQALARRQLEGMPPTGQPDLQRRPGTPLPREEMERRWRHAEVAIEHLHAAGMHEAAERLQREVGRQRGAGEAPREPGPATARIAEELGRVRAELDELRANLRELRQHLTELHDLRGER